MKKQLLTLIGILFASYICAQKVEVSVQANSGLFRYSGVSTTNSSFINQGSDDKNSYTNNPYGNNNTLSYDFNLQTQLVTKSGFIMGMQTGYDIMRSRVTINQVYPYRIYTLPYVSYLAYYNTTGDTYLTNRFINLNPYIGYRFKIKKVKLDIMPGMDIGFNIGSHEKGYAKVVDQDQEFRTDKTLSNAPTDVRLKLGATAYYKKFGLTTGLGYGLINYQQYIIGGPAHKVHSEYFRFGISYRIY